MMRCLTFFVVAGLSATLQAQEINITSPVAGAQVPIGQPCIIGWTSTNLAGQTLTITVQVGGNSVMVADLVPVEAGQYRWDIPWELLPTNSCSVSIQAEEGARLQTNGPGFAIISNTNPVLLVRAPAGGEQWPQGMARSVSWEPHNLDGNLTLELLQDGSVVDTVTNLGVAALRCQYPLPASPAAGTNYALRLTSVLQPAATVTSRAFAVTADAPPTKPWTVLIYMDGDNNLESGPLQDLKDLGTLGSSSNINYVVQLDRTPGYDTNYGNWYDTKRFYVTNGTTPDPQFAIQDLGELDMSSPETLTDFINWAVENYPAERYFLICADHGDGWQGLLQDWTPTERAMTTRQLQQALEAADAPMAILGLDMCLEAYLEVAHQLRNTGPEILIASQYQEDRDWPYEKVFRQLEERQGQMENRALAILMCEAGVAKYPPLQPGTLAAVLLDQVQPLTDSMAGFADIILGNVNDQQTIRAQASNVADKFHQAVLYCAKNQGSEYFVNGLNVFFPQQPTTLVNLYTPALQDFAADAQWQNFVTNYLVGLTNTWIGAARNLVQAPGGEDKVDLLRFLQAINPADSNAWVTFAQVGLGSVLPATDASIVVQKGQSFTISAAGYHSSMPPTDTHFVRWWVSGDAQIGDLLAATNTLTVNGDALVMAFFSDDKPSYTVTFVPEGNGSLNGTNELTFEVPAGGACPTVTPAADPGYVFSAWGGDWPASANPLTLTNVQSDMTVIGFFWPVPPTLSIQQAGTSVQLTWPVSPPDYVLESAGNVSAGPWTPVPGVTTNSVTLPISTTNQFFRLRNASNQGG